MKYLYPVFIVLLCLGCSKPKENMDALCLRPDNPHYFQFRGKPVVLISSAEHYGAVMNREFDFLKYLNTLQAEGLNYTRLFCSGHVEADDPTFGIEKNTMGPSRGNYLTPWKIVRVRADTLIPVFDLDQWNTEYFSRLRNFVEEAGKRGIVVEITLSSSCYNPGIWNKNPFNGINNINLPPNLNLRRVQTIQNGRLLFYQEELVKKLVRELNEFDNIFFEVQNEPWADHPCLVEIIPNEDVPGAQEWQKLCEIANPVSHEWQMHITEIITETEKSLPLKHLIAHNISNFRARVDKHDPRVSIYNFHYALPEAASWNSGLNAVTGLDETGFMPHEDILYRRQAWQFILAGGALYNNLDYSYTAGYEEGSWTINNNPGWGGANYRKQVKILKDFIESFDFVRMKNADELILSKSPENLQVQILAEEGRQYALYLVAERGGSVKLSIPSGHYTIETVNPATSEKSIESKLDVITSEISLTLQGNEDMAFRIVKN
ncbi:MAG: hypothetical protein U0T82_08315 [Bacteroidales bacterium]